MTDGDDARLKVVFNNGTKDVATIYVKKSDNVEMVVYDPGVGELDDGVLFEGWVEDPNYNVNTESKTIADVRSDVTKKLAEGITDADAAGGASVTYYAKLVKQYNITYFDGKSGDGTGNGVSLGTTAIKVLASATGEDAKAKHTVMQAYTPDGDEDFEGWKVADGGENIVGHTAGTVYPNGTDIEVTGDVIFSVNAPKGHWLIFHENKGTYIAPDFIKTGDVTEKPSLDMKRKGYIFAGWYEDAEFSKEFTFGNELSATTHLYAKWEPEKRAYYTILVWKQNVNDKKDAADAAKTYDFVKSVPGEGNVGDNIDVSSAYLSGKDIEGFVLNRAETDIKITPEGNAVANIYYDRALVTLTFKTYTGGIWGSWEDYQVMTGLYGSSLASNNYKWPTDYKWTNTTSSQGGSRTTFLDAFIPNNGAGSTSQTFYGHSLSGRTPIYFYQQNADKSGYTLVNTVYGSANGSFTITDKYNGFRAVSYSKNGTSWTSVKEKDKDGNYDTIENYSALYIRFDREEYSILFMDGAYVDRDGNPVSGVDSQGTIHEVNGITYDQDVKQYNNYTPDAEHTPKGFVFDGWYVDDRCTQEYTFNKMPQGVTVYAKWRLVYVRVFLRPNAGTDTTLKWGSDDQAMNFLRPYGDQISTPTGTRDEFEFIGWFFEDGTFYNEDAFVVNDNIVTEYDKTSSDYYTDPMDKWGNGATYNKDVDRKWVNGKIELFGKWRAVLVGADGIGLIYDAGKGGNAPEDTTLYKDQAKAIAGAASTPTDDKLKFEYWSIQTYDTESGEYKDSGKKVFPGEDFDVLKADAKVEELEGSTEEEPKFSYTVQLKAVYGPKDAATPTHIYWYKNDGTDAFVKQDKLVINEATEIQPAQTRDGYTFLGWYRIDIGDTQEAATTWEMTESNWTQELDAPNFLYYNAEDGKFYTDEAFKNVATKIAADENTPYQALFAVWERKPVTLTIQKQLEGSIEYVEMPTAFEVTVTIQDANNELEKLKELNESIKDEIKIEGDKATITVSIEAPEGTGEENITSSQIKLLAGMTYKIVEKEYKGFTANYENQKSAEEGVTADETKAKVTNTAQKVTPAGLALDTTAAKTALLSLFAFAMMCVLGFSLKRRYVSQK